MLAWGAEGPWAGDAGSTKACYNHTEGTAGLLGVVLAMHALQQAVTPPVAHARELNPYVAAALGDWASASHLRSIISRVGWLSSRLTRTLRMRLRRQQQQCCPHQPSRGSERVCGVQEPAALPQVRQRLVAGTSSFGMSGVNAHGLFMPPDELPSARTAAVPWQRSRHWVVPPAHHLAQVFAYVARAGVAR